MRVLHIDSSMRKERSVSRMLTQLFIDELSGSAGVRIDRLDLAENPPRHITQDFQDALRTRESNRTDTQIELLSESNSLINRLRKCEVMVMGISMYNFSIPSTLKTFLDNIVISGQTFMSDENGDRGLLSGIKAIVINARGGRYDDDEGTTQLDFVVPYIKCILAYIGITDITCIKAGPTQFYGPEAKKLAIETAKEQVIQTVADMRLKPDTL